MHSKYWVRCLQISNFGNNPDKTNHKPDHMDIYNYFYGTIHILRHHIFGIFGPPSPTENQIGNCVAGDFCQYWNLIFQITFDFDILIMVSKAKFQKKLNGKNRFT